MAVDGDLVDWIRKGAAPLKEAPLTAEVVLDTARFSLPYPDPADRFLVATARYLGLTLARISHERIEKGCLFWHKHFVDKNLRQKKETAL
jgi:hypothetical protein